MTPLRYLIKTIIASLGIGAFAFWLFVTSQTAQAQSVYPITDLGNCRDAKECYLYCEISYNKPSCWSYGNFKLPQVLGSSTNITFPVAELGDCSNVTSCKAFCNLSENHEVCVSFARSKGLGEYKKEYTKLQKAKQLLGCSSYESCKTFCEKEENHDACKKITESIETPEEKTHKEEILSKAKTVLGCDSYDSCRTFCLESDNREKCAAFSKAASQIRTNTESIGRSTETHRTENRIVDRKANCKTSQECKNWCQNHPNDCPGFKNEQERRNILPTHAIEIEPSHKIERSNEVERSREIEPTHSVEPTASETHNGKEETSK